MVEMPVALTVFFIFLAFPLIDLATIALRTATVYLAVYNAAHDAARAATFQGPAPTNSADPPFAKGTAIQIARDKALETKAACLAGTDFGPDDVKVRIVCSPLNKPPDPDRPNQGPKVEFVQADNQRLSKKIDPDFVYSIEVTINAQVQPLFTLSSGLFGNVPGLTVPIPVSATARQFSENSEGLTQ